VSLLPPRPLDADWQVASEYAQSLLAQSEPFEVEFTEPAIFPITGVIYLEVGVGREKLRLLHQSLNRGAVAFAEPFPYCPHSTLAQGLKPEQVQEVYELALRRWKEFGGPHRFVADHAVFVQNLNGKTWVDLATLRLGRVPAKS
jgi:2'-5' RNA ligase